MKKFYTTLIALVFCLTLVAKNNTDDLSVSLNTPDGQVILAPSLQKMLVKFQDNTTYNDIKTTLEGFDYIQPIVSEMVLPSPKVVIVELKDIPSEGALSLLLEDLNQVSIIDYANPFYAHHDGTLQASLGQLLAKVNHPNDIKLLAELLPSFGIEEIIQNEFDKTMYQLVLKAHLVPQSIQIAERIQKANLFEFVEPNFLRLMKKLSAPNDPYFQNQWSLENTGQYNGQADMDMDMLSTWLITSGSENVSIAILDEGVDIQHPDLKANLKGGYDATEQGSEGHVTGSDAHGTACAGIAAARGNNNIGMTGIAHDSKIVPVRIAYTSNENWITTNQWIANAINWSWEFGGADVLSNSWGGGSASYSINVAIANAIMEGRNGLGTAVIFAAGNEGTDVIYPATNPNVIAVGAINMCGELKTTESCDGESWWGSNYGPGLDVVAPGVKIFATDNSGTEGYSGGDYISFFNGTSSACPAVAGVMGLIFSANPNLTMIEARQILESTCEKPTGYDYQNIASQPNGTWSNELGYGCVNALAAVQAAAPQTTDDASIVSVDYPVGIICETTINPIVTVRNGGANAITSLVIEYQVDGSEAMNYNWTGNLESTAVTAIELPAITTTEGTHEFVVKTTTPNGQTDSNPENDSEVTTFTVGTNDLTFNITLDNYGSENAWALRDANGTVVLTDGPFENFKQGLTISNDFCLGAGCYTLTVYDSYSDGMCCGYGDGGFELINNSTNEIIESGSAFTDKYVIEFCLTDGNNTVVEEEETFDPLVVELTDTKSVSCFDGNDGKTTAVVSGGKAPYTYMWSNGQSTATLTEASVGTYTVVITDARGETAEATLAIEQPTALIATVTKQDIIDENLGSANLAIVGGTAPYTVKWSNDKRGIAITQLTAGTYTALVIDANACSTEAEVTIEDLRPEEEVNNDLLKFENGILTAVGKEWQTVTLNNTYESMIVVATVHASIDKAPVVTRIQNTIGNQFDIKIQVAGSETAEDTYKVQYMVVEEGVYTEEAHGVNMEAKKVNSTITSNYRSWVSEYQTYAQSYSRPVVFGQVMSYNDENWSSFWASNGSRFSTPNSRRLAVGKHTGEDNTTREDETIGYIVIEEGLGIINNEGFYAQNGWDYVRGIQNRTTGYTYYYNGVETNGKAILSSAGMDGRSGGWPVFVGDEAIQDTRLSLAIDEDRARDSERAHTSEQVAFIVFGTLKTNGTNSETPIMAQTTPPTFEEELTTATAISVSTYPNPTVDQLNIAIQGMNTAVNLTIFDAQGGNLTTKNQVINPTQQATTTINVSELPAGIYYLNISSNEHIQTIPFVKARL